MGGTINVKTIFSEIQSTEKGAQDLEFSIHCYTLYIQHTLHCPGIILSWIYHRALFYKFPGTSSTIRAIRMYNLQKLARRGWKLENLIIFSFLFRLWYWLRLWQPDLDFLIVYWYWLQQDLKLYSLFCQVYCYIKNTPTNNRQVAHEFWPW